MTKISKAQVWQVMALLALVFSFGASSCLAGPFIVSYGAPDAALSDTGSQISTYGAGGQSVRRVSFGDNGSAAYRAALSVPSAPSFSTSAAGDYLSSVCSQGTFTWQSQAMPIKIFIGDGAGIPGYKPVFRDYVRRGFDSWCQASQGKLAWREVAGAAEANITVAWTNSVTHRPEGTEAGRTSVLTKFNTREGRGIIYGARMQFLTQLPNRPFLDEEVEKTCLHEAGHAMGLQGHSPYRDDIMYYAVAPTPNPSLSPRDCNTLVKLYETAPRLNELVLRSLPASGTPTSEQQRLQD